MQIEDIRLLINSQTYYEANCKLVRQKILEDNLPTIYNTLQVITSTLKQSNQPPLNKFLAVRLAKDSIETFNDEFIMRTQIQILPIYQEIALFDSENIQSDRGKNYFKHISPDDKQIELLGNSFLRLILESIFVWSKWFPFDPDQKAISKFKMAYETLIIQHVFFPQLFYFKPDFVKSHLPNEILPKVLLRQIRGKIYIQLIKEGKLKVTPDEQHTYRMKAKKLKTDDINEIFTDNFKRVIRRYNKYKQILEKKSPNCIPNFEDIIEEYKIDTQNLKILQQQGSDLDKSQEQSMFIKFLKQEIQEIKEVLFNQSSIEREINKIEQIPLQKDMNEKECQNQVKKLKKLQILEQQKNSSLMKEKLFLSEQSRLLENNLAISSKLNSEQLNSFHSIKQSTLKYSNFNTFNSNTKQQQQYSDFGTAELSELNLPDFIPPYDINDYQIPKYLDHNVFKKACFKDKALLFEDSQILVGIVSFLTLNEKLLKFKLYITNKQKKKINDFYIDFIHNEEVKFAREPEYVSSDLKESEQIEIDIVVELKQIPYKIIHFELKYNMKKLSLSIPMLLNKFSEKLKSDQDEFDKEWQKLQSYSRSNLLNYNEKIFQSVKTFSEYFCMSSTNITYLGFYQKYKIFGKIYLLKIYIDNKGRMILQSKSDGNQITLFINTMIFIMAH